MKRDDFIKLISKTDAPIANDSAKYAKACRDAVEFAFTHWLFDNGQDHSKNASLIAACVKKRNEILANG